jgi:hypothetical protein
VIDPRRSQWNDARARELAELYRRALQGAHKGNAEAIAILQGISKGMRRNWDVPAPFDDATIELHRPTNGALAVGMALVDQAFEPLRAAVRALEARKSSPTFSVNGQEFTISEPTSPAGHHVTWMAPLALHVCPDLVRAVGDVRIAIFDPSRGAPLKMERKRFARERTKLIEIEHELWQLAYEAGALSDRIPYAFRLTLLVWTWIPEVHDAPGAHTLCIRCGDLLFRKRLLATANLPRCTQCMKETPAQREWPAHAMAPHAQGTWLLRCQYPECEMVFEGPRHRKLCDEHTSSRLAPRRRHNTRVRASSRRRN